MTKKKSPFMSHIDDFRKAHAEQLNLNADGSPKPTEEDYEDPGNILKTSPQQPEVQDPRSVKWHDGPLLLDPDAREFIGWQVAEFVNDDIINDPRNPLSIKVYPRMDFETPMICSSVPESPEDAVDNLAECYVVLSLEHDGTPDQTWFIEVYAIMEPDMTLKYSKRRILNQIMVMTRSIVEAKAYAPKTPSHMATGNPLVDALIARDKVLLKKQDDKIAFGCLALFFGAFALWWIIYCSI